MKIQQLLLSQQRTIMKFIDIGANLTDPVFRGNYRGKQKHEDDFSDVLKRGFDVGLEKIVVTGGSLSDCKEALKLCEANEQLYCTVGCHPTRCNEFLEHDDPDEYLRGLMHLTSNEKVVAIGECGLDYDRLHFCDKETQLKFFEQQLQLAESTQLPMFLHCREAFADFVEIVERHRGKISGGVVHSFTGTVEEAKTVLDLGFFIGINGCSLKTRDNIEAMKSIPSDKLMLETDCPWCDVRPTHAGYGHVESKFVTKKKWESGSCVKGRNELCNIVQVLEIVAAERGEDKQVLADLIYQNSKKMFFPKELV